MTTNKFAFGKENFYMIGVSIALIITGFILMSGGGSIDGVEFNNEMFDTQRIIVAPATTLLGFILMIAAIIYKPKSN